MTEPPHDTDERDDIEACGADDDDVVASQIGGAPVIVGGERMRKQVAAALFGDDAPIKKLDDAPPASFSGDAETMAAVDAPPSTRSELSESAIGERLGRFRVLERLGKGGMGVVYSAYDPQLDRKIAVKLLRPDVQDGMASEAATARLLREAQAMAKISDPNVIVVHEVGVLKGRVFLAMEFVDGGTLGSWMATGPSWREVLEVFLKAGSGLVAAHRGGLVHRDFKPENVLMGTDGRVRVVDFGLARSLFDAEVEEPTTRPSGEEPELDSFNTPLTRTGAIMGTPAYMSPEQHLGRAATARADQFSFCVAMWEALFGRRPFRGTSLAELTGNVLGGVIREPPSDVHVPRWVVGVVRRGLARDPDDRFDTMEALLKELRRDPRRKWRIGVVGTVGVATAVFLGIGTYQKVLTGACDDLADAMGTTWNPQRREAMVASIAGADVPWAEQVAKSTADAVAQYAETWGRRVQNECLASQVGSQAAKTTWTNKRLCFEDRRSGVDVLISELIDGGEGMATTALQAAVSLPDLDACRDSQRLAMWELMSDPKAQERLAYARRRLVRGEMVGSLGRAQKAIEAATAVIEDARELGVPALEAAGLLVRGLNRIRIGENDPKVEEDLQLAVERAQEAGDAATRAKALIQLGAAVGREPTRFQEAFAIGERAREAIESLGSAPLLGARLQAMLGVAARRAGDWDAAIAYNRESIATLETLLGESHPDTVRTLNGLGISLCRKGEFEEALAALRRAVAAYENLLGGTHPDLFTVQQSLGVCFARQNRTEEALEMLTRALANYRQGASSDETRILTYEYNIAFVHYRSGNHQESLRRAQAGLPRAKKLLAGRPKRLADWHGLLGKSLMGTGDAKGAAAALKDALAIQRGAKASAADTLHLQLRIALSTAEFDRERGLVLVEALQGELVRAPSSPGIDLVQAELDGWLAKDRQGDSPTPPESDGESPTRP